MRNKKISFVWNISKSSIWENMIIWRSFRKKTWSWWDLHSKDLIISKSVQINRWHEREINQINAERQSTDKDSMNVRRYQIRKIVFDDLMLNNHHFDHHFLLLSCSDDVKYHCKYLSHALTWERDDVWIKQTNKWFLSVYYFKNIVLLK